ncbi:MAG: hypothetical protein PHW63_10255, partial [Alphaproteobacteria bacterium]|nr:hypothetical protein [Alphaproteobacteria bacterium]
MSSDFWLEERHSFSRLSHSLVGALLAAVSAELLAAGSASVESCFEQPASATSTSARKILFMGLSLSPALSEMGCQLLLDLEDFR